MDITVHIDGLAAGGDGVARNLGKVCFVPHAAPGDTLRVRITQDKPKFQRGKILEILEGGEGRREPPCPHFGECGGCTWLHLRENAQLKAKTEILTRHLRDESVRVTPSPESLGYRRLARLHFDPKSNSLGFMQTKNRRVVEITRCPVLSKELSDSLYSLKEALFGIHTPVEVRLALGMDGAIAVIQSHVAMPSTFYSRARDLTRAGFAGVVLDFEGLLSTLEGHSMVKTMGFDDAPFLEPATSFGQANEGVNRELVKTVSSWIKDSNCSNILELFSGSGNLTVPIAPFAKHTTTAELDKNACAAARQNIANRCIKGVTVNAADALEAYQSSNKPFDLIVLDPPRTGHLELATAIASGPTSAVLYVSCNPSTLARDAKELERGGFRLTRAKGFDMFPQTPHIEVATLFER